MYQSCPRWVLQSALGILLVGALNVILSTPSSVSGYQATTAQNADKSCPAGYKAVGEKCEDINECLKDNGGCDPRTTCRNTPGSRTCGECPEGFAGDGYQGCTDVNESSKPDDIAPPVITTSGDVTAAASSEKGAVVEFKTFATDRADGERPVSCKPASGSTFPIGTTTVTCSATDTQGNRGTATLKVTVTKP